VSGLNPFFNVRGAIIDRSTVRNMRASVFAAVTSFVPLLVGFRQILYPLRIFFVNVLINGLMADGKLGVIDRYSS